MTLEPPLFLPRSPQRFDHAGRRGFITAPRLSESQMDAGGECGCQGKHGSKLEPGNLEVWLDFKKF